jgi:hypothetical protein
MDFYTGAVNLQGISESITYTNYCKLGRFHKLQLSHISVS